MASESVNIGRAALATGVSAKMIRHYEEIGLLEPKRNVAGYRTFSNIDLHDLRFIRHCRRLGFSIKQIGELLQFARDRSRSSSEVKRLATHHMEDLNQRIRQLQVMKNALEKLAERCAGDDRPECPILDGLAAEPDRSLEPREDDASEPESELAEGSRDSEGARRQTG